MSIFKRFSILNKLKKALMNDGIDSTYSQFNVKCLKCSVSRIFTKISLLRMKFGLLPIFLGYSIVGDMFYVYQLFTFDTNNSRFLSFILLGGIYLFPVPVGLLVRGRVSQILHIFRHNFFYNTFFA